MSAASDAVVDPVVPAETLPMRLYMARKRPDNTVVSQRRAALAAGVSHGTWQNWEQGKSEPRVSQLHRIAAYLAVDEGWLLTGRRPTTAPDPAPAPDEGQPSFPKVRHLTQVPAQRMHRSSDIGLPRLSVVSG